MLSQEPTGIVENPLEYVTWIVGPPGVGKTTWAAEAPDTWFAKTEQGTKGVSVVGDSIPDWPTFLKYGKHLKEGAETGWKEQRPIKTVVIDTFESLWNMAGDHIMRTTTFDGSSFVYPSDVPYGRAYERINELVFGKLLRLQSLGFGLILISHEKPRTFKWGGGEHQKYEPNVKPQTYKTFNRLVDCLGYFYVEEAVRPVVGQALPAKVEVKRIQRWQPTFVVDAKHRLTGFPDELPLPGPGETPNGWEVYCEAFAATVEKLRGNRQS